MWWNPLDIQISDERSEARSLISRLEIRRGKKAAFAAASFGVAGALAYLPAFAGLSAEARHCLFILVSAAALWVSEAISAYAVALVVMGLEILLLAGLGRKGDSGDYLRYLTPWSSSIIWVLLGGFVLGKAATKTGLDRWLARSVIRTVGTTPRRALLGIMGVGFVLSMFMSNTAATAMLLAVTAPVIEALAPRDPLRRAFLLGVPVSANVGGMGTLVGSPPNAIAAGVLGEVNFSEWMLFGLPPALLLFALSYWLLVRKYEPLDREARVELPDEAGQNAERLPAWRRYVVVGVFTGTVGLWMTSGVHETPMTVVSFLPVVVFAATGVLRPGDVRALPWDVLLLVAGGLSLGATMSDTGLAAWLVERVPVPGSLGATALAFALAIVAMALSNVMSNTAAANVLIPIGVALAHGHARSVAIPIALAASCAMLLPVSTPPNALAFASGELDARDFRAVGLLIGLAGPVVIVAWCWILPT